MDIVKETPEQVAHGQTTAAQADAALRVANLRIDMRAAAREVLRWETAVVEEGEKLTALRGVPPVVEVLERGENARVDLAIYQRRLDDAKYVLEQLARRMTGSLDELDRLNAQVAEHNRNEDLRKADLPHHGHDEI